MEKQIFHFPRWTIALYTVSVAVLIPWTYSLAENLPSHHLAHHWDIAWTGFDIFELLLFILTTVLALKRTIWVTLSATALSTILLVDVWFDVLTSKPGKQETIAILLALFIELPIALVTYVLAYRTTLHLHKRVQSLSFKDV